MMHNFSNGDKFNKRSDEMLGRTSQPPDHFLPGDSFAVKQNSGAVNLSGKPGCKNKTSTGTYTLWICHL
jgi:hypothetical protein